MTEERAGERQADERTFAIGVENLVVPQSNKFVADADEVWVKHVVLSDLGDMKMSGLHSAANHLFGGMRAERDQGV